MKLRTAALLLALAAASPEIKYFRYQRPIQNTPQQPAQTCLVVDPAIFAHAAPQLADLRLYRDEAETPYIIQVAAPVEAAEKSIVPLNLGQRAGQTAFDAAMPDAPYSDIQLAVTGQNFIATVTVYGSQTQSSAAETKLGTFTIFDLTRQRLGRSTVLHLPQSDFRYLHFHIAGPLAPESITGLWVTRLPASQPRYVTVAETSSVIEKNHSSVVEFTVPAHVPVDQIVTVPGATPALFQPRRPSFRGGDFATACRRNRTSTDGFLCRKSAPCSQRAKRPSHRRGTAVSRSAANGFRNAGKVDHYH